MPEAVNDWFPRLTTPRLVLRQLKDEDAASVFALRSNACVGRYIDRDLQQHIGEAKAFIEKIIQGYSGNTTYYWVLGRKDSETFLGTICLWNFSADKRVAEIGYELLPEHFGQGYMQEALNAVCEYGFTVLKLAAIEAFTHRDNSSSKNLLERNGFVRCEGRVDAEVPANVIYRKERALN